MAGFRKFGRLESAFSKQPHSIGHMPAPSAELDVKSMKPMAAKVMGPKAVQTPAQHAAVEKAAKVSAMKRSKKGLI